MSLESTTCEGEKVRKSLNFNENSNFFLADLKAFERRLTEVLACLHPSCLRWRSKCLNKIVENSLIGSFQSSWDWFLRQP